VEKLKFGFYWAASCGGCEIAVLDVDDKILQVMEIAEIVFWPVAMDVKYRDVEAMPDGFMDVCFFNGAIRSSEQRSLAELLRRKAKTLVAFGACAQLGGVPGLANEADATQVYDRAYHSSPSNDNPQHAQPETHSSVPEGPVEIPRLHNTVKPLDKVVEVDYYLPGCPPPPTLIFKAIDAIASGKLPPKGSILAPERAVCEECPRKKEDKRIPAVKRVIDSTPEPEKCLLDQGYVCMGPATRGGCEAQCLNANMPCTGCGGPCPGAEEQGAAMLSALSTVLGLGDEKQEGYDAESLMSQVKDPLGTFYKYSLPASIIPRRRMK
jgi:F420-non-reducing hydrogenase small subunit